VLLLRTITRIPDVSGTQLRSNSLPGENHHDDKMVDQS
jgi:hypothetical protein